MGSNKVKYSPAAGPYCTTHDSRVPFFTPEFSISKIISHRFNIDNNKCEPVIFYSMIIGHYMMVQLVLMKKFKQHVLQWDDPAAPINIQAV